MPNNIKKMMTASDILKLLDSKNHNLPTIKLQTDHKNLPLVFVPVIEGDESKVKKQFSFLRSEKLSGKKGESLQQIHNNEAFYFVGIGKKLDSRTMRRFYGSMYTRAQANKPKTIGLACTENWVKEAAIGIHVAALDARRIKPKNKPAPNVILFDKSLNKPTAKKAFKAGMILAESKNLMRVLGSMPPNILNQKTYAEVIVALAKKWGVKCERVAQTKLKKYELLNAVSQGSSNRSELLIFTLHPKGKKTKSGTAVVGKGLVYDSGGLIGKQNYMKSMKEDMAGSASVLGAVHNIAKGGLKLKQTTYVLMPLAENMMGPQAMRADDIYVTGDGQTVEIIHTDAEGRLVMADAICYAKQHFKDIHRYYTIATLTGSCVQALGDVYTGTVCNDENLAKMAEAAGKTSGDYVHVAPWNLEYDDNNSPLADVANLGENKGEAGWIKAGLFLYRFVPELKKGGPSDRAKGRAGEKAEFCHFDIAGSIDMDEKGKPWRAKGLNSGVGVALLSELLTD